MPQTGEEIRARLTAFAARWSIYEGSERSEAQTFLNELFECYGVRRSDVARFEEHQAGRFLDLIWPRVCLIEMKAPREAARLGQHRGQALQYWIEAADALRNLPAPRFVVLCAFRRLEIWEPGAFPRAPRLELDLIDLPDQYDALLFLAGDEPIFAGGQAAVTREAVGHLVELHTRLSDRQAGPPDVLRDFLLQSVWSMFAEDLGQLPAHRFTHLVDELITHPLRSSADELGQLFSWLNTPGERPLVGLYAGTPYANGGLFETPAHVHLAQEELELLRAAAAFQWRDVQPSIFGSMLEGGLGHDQQWRLSAHYTHEADIQKVVQPTIVTPWRDRIENLSTHAQAVAAQNDMLNYVVLDPACGSGNFLYVAYRELRRLEKRLHEREVELRRREGHRLQESISLHFPLSNLRGIEIEAFAVALARVTLWMAHKLAVDELDLSEATLPLADLSGIRIGDALRVEWPRADAIVSNPPFHGDRNLRRILGDDYVEWLKEEFEIGVKDYCVYWFRKAHETLEPGKRAGLVGTNSISQNRARGVSLQYIVENGGVIVSAVSSQDWPGEAAVDVSIVNWVKDPEESLHPVILDGEEVAAITPSLRAGTEEEPPALAGNDAIAYQGMLPGANYLVDGEVAITLRGQEEPPYRDVIRPYLSGDDIANDPLQQPSRFVVDFGVRTLEEAMAYPEALQIVRRQAKDSREGSRSYSRNPRWWQFLWPRPVFRERIAGRSRFLAGTATGKRIFFCWCDSEVVASNSTNVFAVDDDYHLGVLSSTIHTAWAEERSSTLEDRIRYTPTSAFKTFPWPPAVTDAQRDEIRRRTRAVLDRRSAICVERSIGLTTVYNEIDEGAYEDLAGMHVALDEAVAAAYGWPRSTAERLSETKTRLYELNRSISEGGYDYHPFDGDVP
jgi:hypothetical protein